MSYTHLSFEDRTALMLECVKPEFSARKFAKQIHRHHSIISRELNRNTVSITYHSQDATLSALSCRRRGHHKLIGHSILWKFIVKAISCLWSPEQISKRLKLFPDLDNSMKVSHTTIYSTIRALPKGELKKRFIVMFKA